MIFEYHLKNIEFWDFAANFFPYQEFRAEIFDNSLAFEAIESISFLNFLLFEIKYFLYILNSKNYNIFDISSSSMILAYTFLVFKIDNFWNFNTQV